MTVPIDSRNNLQWGRVARPSTSCTDLQCLLFSYFRDKATALLLRGTYKFPALHTDQH
ncbi:hypothetical protein PISMIDRAFT_684986 [Pisolithus microcarpus 441]|uniref:Uncharacterized protein n=1 Tax=Pisolithus microcarpus 441 TaxID=765257 RepID=A0A0C9Z5M6_9AGAM|nr:hypothetical protein PISMIDRAFT_684986 [Pisolithus microcarpus 441]